METALHTYRHTLCLVADNTAGERMTKLIDEKADGVRPLARRARVSPGTIREIKRRGLGDSSLDIVSRVAEALGVSIMNLRRIDAGLPPIPDETLAKIKRLEVHPNWLQFPVYGPVTAGDLTAEPIDDDVVFIPKEHLTRSGSDPDSVRTFIVNGQCMISAETMKIERNFAPGDYIAVDLDKRPRPGDIVVAWWDEREAMIIKRYGVEEGSIVLSPIAPGHPSVILPEDADARVLGTVVWRGG